MGYVGTAPLSGDYRKLDDISGSFNGSTTEFDLEVGSVAVTPPKETTLLISVGGVLQEPVSAYTVSGSAITFTAAPADGADFFGILLGDTMAIGTPSDATVTAAKLASTFLTGISATTTVADADLILIDDAAGGTFRKMTRAHFIESAAVDAIDIDGGAIDGTPIGANSTSTIAGTSGAFSTDVTVGDDLSLTSDSAVFNMGAGNDFTITHDGTTGATLAGNPITITAGGASSWTTSAGALTLTSAAAATWSTAAGALTLNGTGGVNINEGGSTIIGISDARAVSTTNTASIDLDASGAIQINSSGGALSVGNDNVDQAVNIATAGTRTLTLGINDATDLTTINALAPITIESVTLTDETVSGITSQFETGEDMNRGDVAYFKASDSKMWKADADTTAEMPVVAMAAEDIDVSSEATGLFLLFGFLGDNGTFPAYTVAGKIYAPETEGPPTQTAPSTDGDFVQVLGWAVTANSVFFNPSLDVIEHA